MGSPRGNLRAHLFGDELLYRDAHYLSAEVEIDEAAARGWLPLGMRLRRPARGTVFTAWFPENPFGEVYTEAGLFLHVRFLGVEAVFCPWMLVSSSAALVAGRELLGYPKKMAEIVFERDGDAIRSRASREGREVLSLDASLGAEVAPSAFLGRRHANVRGNLGLLRAHVVTFRPQETPVSVRAAEVEVSFGNGGVDDLGRLVVGRSTAGTLHRVNLGLSAGGYPVPVVPVSPTFVLRNDDLRNR